MLSDVGDITLQQLLFQTKYDVNAAINLYFDGGAGPQQGQGGAPPPSLARQAPPPPAPAVRISVTAHEAEMFEPGAPEQHLMLVGYIGSGFSGFQASQDDNVKTVQGELLKALHRVGALPHYDTTRLLHGELLKALHRVGALPHYDTTDCYMSSRTDKGVHASQLLVQVPMHALRGGKKAAFLAAVDVPMHALRSGKKQAFLAAVARRLKDNGSPRIRVFDVMHATGRLGGGTTGERVKRVNSRQLCLSREYLYVLPAFTLEPIKGGGSRLDDIVNIANKYSITNLTLATAFEVLRLFQGEHDFGAFTLAGRRGEYAAEPSGTRRHIYVCEAQQGGGAEERSGTRRHIYACEAQQVLQGRVQLVVIRIVGDRFMYHQIRMMMGLAMLALQSGVDAKTLFDEAFTGDPRSFKIPLAPAEPLLLSKLDFQVEQWLAAFVEQWLAAFVAGAASGPASFEKDEVIPHVRQKCTGPIAEFVQSLARDSALCKASHRGR
ncbi:pseudouridine synthase [Baffinella frigidus]|nr:pseudouridine synthase [Cryptophyta sp. CCMP2293]